MRGRSASGGANGSRVKAEAALLRAQAKAVLAEAAATTTRAGAEAAATTTRAGAEATRAGAEAAATTTRAGAEAAAATARASANATAVLMGAVRTSVFTAAALLVALGLVIDLVVHESSEFIEWRVKRTLRASAAVLGAPELETPLPVAQPAPILSFLPLMLLGSDGVAVLKKLPPR